MPWKARYEWENNPNGYSGFPGTVFNHIVQFRNTGGRTWTAANDVYGRAAIFLAAANVPAQPQRTGFTTRVSASYVAGNWEANWRPGRTDEQNVVPSAVGTFQFAVVTNGPIGSRQERFDIVSNGLFWFDYWDPPGINGFYVPIYVVCC